MERDVKKIDQSHNEITFKMQGTTERDAWLRTFPHPLPSTHKLAYEWPDDMTLVVRPEPIATPSAGEGSHGPSPADVANVPAPADVAALEGKTIADLQTLAAEKGVILKSGMSKAQIVAAIGDAIGRG